MKAIDTTRTPALLLVAASLILMQWHSISFWVEQTGTIGIAWSLAIEGVAVWFWFQRKTLLAITASLLLVCGPLHELSSPVFSKLQNDENRVQLIEINQTEIKQLTASIKQYQDNSSSRVGWSGRIDRTQTALDNARGEIKQLMSHSIDSIAWRHHAIIAVQILVLLIVMTGQIQAIISLRRNPSQLPINRKLKQAVIVAAVPKLKKAGALVTKTDVFAARVSQLIIAINILLPTFNGRQKALAEFYEFRPADVSMVMNHLSRIDQGKEVIADKALARMEQKLL
jgi:hypothetical protein